jgi:ribonucleoside-diphosphate reductase alpha chain
MTIEVIKRNGSKEPLDINKIHTVVNFACDGISGVSSSEVELKSQLLFFNGITTTQIQETLIKAASELISLENPNYQHVAANLVNYHLRKEVYNGITPPHLFLHVQNVIKEGFYSPELLEWYSEDEFNQMEKFIDHKRDYDLVYIGIEQFREKYLVKNRVTGKIYETPQMAYMLISACLFHNYPKETRMKYVKDYYDMISKHYISLPTPIMAGVRTKTKQFSSCVLINSGDSLDSIIATTGAVTRYVANRAGIGINVGRIRAKGSPVRNGEAFTTGLIPYLKMFAAATKSASQGSIRDGSTTVHAPIWHMEIEDYIVLKNNKGTEENRIRNMDYSVQISKLYQTHTWAIMILQLLYVLCRQLIWQRLRIHLILNLYVI